MPLEELKGTVTGLCAAQITSNTFIYKSTLEIWDLVANEDRVVLVTKDFALGTSSCSLAPAGAITVIRDSGQGCANVNPRRPGWDPKTPESTYPLGWPTHRRLLI